MRLFIFTILLTLSGWATAAELCSSLFAEGEFQEYSSKNRLASTPKTVPIRVGSTMVEVESGVLHVTSVDQSNARQVVEQSQKLSDHLFSQGLHSRVRGRRGENALIHQIPMNSQSLVLSPQQIEVATTRIASAGTIFNRVLQLRAKHGAKLTFQSALTGLGISPESRLALLHLVQHINQNPFTSPLLDSPELSDYPYLFGIDGFDLFFDVRGQLSLVKSGAVDSDWSAGIARSLNAAVADSREKTGTTHYELLRQNARAWTAADGEVVVLAPSEVDVAYSDAAHFAKHTGLRLVFAGDLLISTEGEVEIALAEVGKNIRVIGIHSFLPQSYLLYEPVTAQSSGFPMVQTFVANEQLGLKLGLRLKKGAWYDYVFSELAPQLEPIDIRRDERRRPKFASPVVPVFRTKNDEVVSIVKSLRTRKLYIANLARDWMSDEAIMRDLFNIVSLEQGRGAETSAEWWNRHDFNALVAIREQIDRDHQSQLAAMADPAMPIFSENIDDSVFFSQPATDRTQMVDHEKRLKKVQMPASYSVISDSGSGRFMATNRAARIRIFPVQQSDGKMSLPQDAAVARVAALQVGSFNVADGASYAPVRLLSFAGSEATDSLTIETSTVSQEESERLKRLNEVWERVSSGMREGRTGIQRLDLELLVNLCSRLAHRLPDSWVRVAFASEQFLHQHMGFADFQKELTSFQVNGVSFVRSVK